MSWLSDLTSKAEAMLVKLDQDAAQALQKPDGLLRGTKIIDQALNTISTYRVDDKVDEDITILTDQQQKDQSGEGDFSFVSIDSHLMDNNKIVENKLVQNNNNYVDRQHDNKLSNEEKSSDIYNIDHELYSETINLQTTTIKVDSNDVPMSTSDNNHGLSKLSTKQQTSSIVPQPTTSKAARSTRKFVIQSSKSSSKVFNLNKTSQENVVLKDNSVISNKINNEENELQSVEDIRASIRKTLQQYANQSPQESNNSNTEPKHNSNIIHSESQISSTQQLNYKNDYLLDTPKSTIDNNRLHSSPSFSIDLPDIERVDSSKPSTSDIALRLLQQTALKKTSTFNIHKVLNRLANPNNHTNAIITSGVKIKLRRFKMRMGSYARRLNYHYRTNPMLKYLIIGYLILMQILVIYVLFFYQSTPSNNLNDLSSQIIEQQEKIQRE